MVRTEGEEATARERFFDAAEPLLERYGYRKTTVREVCTAAGASKRTFYELFQDKKDLCARLILRIWNSETDRWEEELESADPTTQLRSLLDFYGDVMRRHPVLGIMTEDLEVMATLGAAVEEFSVIRVGGPAEQILRSGMEAGQFRKADPQLMMWVIFGVLDCFYMLAPGLMNQPGPLEDPDLADEINTFLTNGVGRRGGNT